MRCYVHIVESEDSSVERELCGNMEYPSVSTPNSQHTSPSRSLSANSIKVEQYSDDELGRVLQPCKPTVHMEESWNEEQGENLEEACSEPAGTCGYGEISSPKPASPGSNRLTNGKLKCDICGMICIGPNVLMVHKRSHTGERPFQCNQCGTSFTQKGNLLRHIKLHSGEKPFKCPFCSYACRRRDALTGHLRTHSVCQVKRYKCSSCGRGYKLQSTLDEHRERCHSYWQSLDAQTTNRGEHIGEKVRDTECMPDSFLQPSSDKTTFTDRLTNSITKRKRSTPQKFVEKSMRLNLAEASYELDSDRESEGMVAQHKSTECLYVDGAGGGAARSHTHRPLRHAPPHTPCLSELTPIISSMYTQLGPIGSRMDRPSEGPKEQQFVCNHVPSPSNGCQDSTDTESTAEEQSALPAERESLGVVDSEGQPVRCFRCRHCRIFFLDHVMFTIHMGCHGFRQPLECNICGHRSQDRYEFSSHIIRGEHKVG